MAAPVKRTNQRSPIFAHNPDGSYEAGVVRRGSRSLACGLCTLLVGACGSGNGPLGPNGGNVDPNAAGIPPVTEISPGTGADTRVGESDGGFQLLPTSVNVIITADNAYGFGYGSAEAMANYFGGVENEASSDIFGCPHGPEKYTVPAADANVGNYLYIVSYADSSTTQGVLAQFFRAGGAAVYTGAGPWEVCATGGGPKLPQINEQLGLCNAASTDLATTSAGWRSSAASAGGHLVVGEDNTTPRGSPTPGNEFQVACGIDASARWMWYDWQPARVSGSPFIYPSNESTTNPMKDFLIFRLAARFVPLSPVN